MPRKSLIKPMKEENAYRQAKIAVVLLSIVPALSFFYLGSMLRVQTGGLPLIAEIIVFCCTVVVAVAGYMVLRKYPKNIIKLRQYITQVAEGERIESISLDEAGCSDDLKYIENGLNTILEEMNNRFKLIEEKWQCESGLRKELVQHPQTLLKAEQHRVMIQSLGAACHHLGQPATSLKMRLYLMQERAQTIEEVDEIKQSIKEVESISGVLKRLREINEFRTEPYIKGIDTDDNKILAI